MNTPLKPRGLRYAKAYTAIVRDPTVSNAEIRTWLALGTYANAEGVCYPKVETLSAVTGMDRKTVFRALEALETRRLVKRSRVGGQNCYFLDDQHYAKFLAKSAKIKVPKTGH